MRWTVFWLACLWAGRLYGQDSSFLDNLPDSPGRYDEGSLVALLPSRFIYPAYLAGAKESRLGSQIVHEREDGTLWDSTLGGRFSLMRFNSADLPMSFQVEFEGAAQVRLDPHEDRDVRAVDFRAGVPFSFALGDKHRLKFAYYHLSSHTGDEFLLKNPGFPRLNYYRDALVLGYSYYPSPQLRLYAEADWAFYSEVSEPWAFQFGLEYAPAEPTTWHGEPFVAIHGHLRQEVRFGGNLAFQTGWAWRYEDGGLLRTGLYYFNGESPQFSFFDEFEDQLGVGLWYDF